MALAILWAAQLQFTERGRGRMRRSDTQRRATRLRFALAGLAIAVTLIALVGMHLRRETVDEPAGRQVARVQAVAP